MRILSRLNTCVVVAAIFVLGPTQGWAQAARPPALKAAFLYNFARFAEWPAEALPAGQPLRLCVVGDEQVARALEETVKGRTIEDRQVIVSTLRSDGPLSSCQLLYVSGVDERGLTRLLAPLTGLPVFTAGDERRFLELGGVARLVMDQERMRFEINVTAAGRARLQLSSRLLSLATVVN